MNENRSKMQSNDLIIVKAKITLRATEDNGRQTGIKSGYRPNHVFEYPQNEEYLNTYIGEILFDDKEILLPGETNTSIVRFLKTPQLEKYIKVGQKWYINEGRRIVGYGEIIEK